MNLIGLRLWHLFLVLSCCGLVFAVQVLEVSAATTANGELFLNSRSYERLSWAFMIIQGSVNGVVLAAGIVLLGSRSRLTAPGHWILLVCLINVGVGLTASVVQSLLSTPLLEHWYGSVAMLTLAIAIAIIYIAAAANSEWRYFFCAAAILPLIGVASELGWGRVIHGVGWIVILPHALASALATWVVYLCVRDWRSAKVRDGLHWVGISAIVSQTMLFWGWTIGERLILPG